MANHNGNIRVLYRMNSRCGRISPDWFTNQSCFLNFKNAFPNADIYAVLDNADESCVQIMKDTGTPYKALTDRERNLLQTKLDLIELKFVADVASNRNMPLSEVQKLADGSFYLGIEAKQNGLIDLNGNRDLAIEKAKELANLTNGNVIEYVKKPSLLNIFEKLTAESFYSIGQGLGESLKTKEEFAILAK